jgi:hypothetical protein
VRLENAEIVHLVRYATERSNPPAIALAPVTSTISVKSPTLSFETVPLVGSFEVPSDGASMTIGMPKNAHGASLLSHARNWTAPPATNSFRSAAPLKTVEGGTTFVRELDMEIPCVGGVWHVAQLRRTLGCRAVGGIMLWNGALVGNACSDTAKLIRVMETEVGAHPSYVPHPDDDDADLLRDANIVHVHRYDWDYYREDPIL